MYSGAGGQRSEHGGMFAYIGNLNTESGHGLQTRGETLSHLPTGYQDWRPYRQTPDSLASDLSMDAGLSVSSLNPNLNQVAIHAAPSAASMGWKAIKTEYMPLTSETGYQPSDAHVTDQSGLQTTPTPDEYRQYIRKIYLQNLQKHQKPPVNQQSEWQPPSTEEMMTSDPAVVVETVVYQQELDENGEW